MKTLREKFEDAAAFLAAIGLEDETGVYLDLNVHASPSVHLTSSTAEQRKLAASFFGCRPTLHWDGQAPYATFAAGGLRVRISDWPASVTVVSEPDDAKVTT